jgi:hypothetical protein
MIMKMPKELNHMQFQINATNLKKHYLHNTNHFKRMQIQSLLICKMMSIFYAPKVVLAIQLPKKSCLVRRYHALALIVA